jgi:hypothetical protein
MTLLVIKTRTHLLIGITNVWLYRGNELAMCIIRKSL